MKWEFHSAQSTFAHYAADWDRLNAELFASHPFYDSRFVGPLLKHFASGNELLCLYRGEHGPICGALILQSRGAGRWESFRPSQAQITPLLVANAGVLKELLEALPGFAWSIDFYAIDPRHAPAFSCARADTIISTHARTIGVEPGLGFEDYWNNRPKKLKGNIRRYINHLEREAFTAEYFCLLAPDDMIDGVRRFGELESAGLKKAAGTAISTNNAQGQFYAEVLASFAATTQAEIFEMTIGGQLAASRLLIGNQKMQVILKTTTDEALARFAPCRLMLHRLLERQLHEHPGIAVEFYTNTTRDQAEWATVSCDILNVQLFRNDGAVVAYALLNAIRRRLAGGGRAHQSSEGTHSAFEIHSCASVEDLVAGREPFTQFAPGTSIEESLDWFDLLQKQIYPDNLSVRYYIATDRGRPTAILPLRQTRHGRVGTVESLSNYYTSLYSPLINKDCDQRVLGPMLLAAMRENRDAHVMRFAPMDPDAPAYAALLNELRATGWIPLTYFCFGNWFLKIEGGWEDYLRKRSANLRSTLKRMNKKFAAEGGMLEVFCGSAELERGIAAFEEVYSASWKKPEPYPNFVPALIRLVAAAGMLRLGIAWIGDKPIAAQLWISGVGKASIYKVAYHEEYSCYSPGTVLTGFLMQHVIENDHVSEVDYLIGDDKYKQIWMSDRRERWGIIAFNPRSFVGFTLLLKEVVGRLVKLNALKLAARVSRTKEVLERKFGGSSYDR